MGKVVFLEFDEDCTLEEIKRELISYRDLGFRACTKINGEMVYSDDCFLSNTFERIALNIPKSKEDEFDELTYELNSLGNKRIRIVRVNSNFKLNYYMNLALRLVPCDIVYKFQDDLAKFTGDIIILTSKLLLALEGDNIIEIHRNIDRVITEVNGEDDIISLRTAVKLVIKYSNKGEILNNMFFMDSMDMYEARIDYREIELNKEIKKLSRNK